MFTRDASGQASFTAWLKFNKVVGEIHSHFLKSSDSYHILHRRTGLSPLMMIAFMLDQGGTCAARIRSYPLFSSALQDLKLLAQLDPDKIGPVHWSLLRYCCQSTSEMIAVVISRDQVGWLADRLDFRLNPESTTIMLKIYFRELVCGNEKEALNYSNGLLERLVA